MRRKTLLALLCAFCLLAVACGQKSGVAGSAGGTGDGIDVAAGGAVDTGVDAGVGADVAAGDPGAAVPADTGTSDTTPAGGGAAAPSSGTPSKGSSSTAKPSTGATTKPGGAPSAATAGPGTRTGIDDDKKVIRIGIHAPVTGAAPFPQNQFDDGKDVYWKFLEKKGGLFGGYKVEVVFRDDQFNPQRAVQVCREMVEQEKVFLLVGGGGADQITACAKYANQLGVPYLSAGVNENGITGLKTFFALSMTYAQQAPLLAQLIKNKIGKTKVGVIVIDTPSFVDGQQAFLRAAQAAGLTIVRNSKIGKNANQTETATEMQQQQAAGAEVIYVLVSPTTFINLAATKSTTYAPAFVGPGITAGLDTVAKVGCPGAAGAQFLSPFPQLDAIDAMDPDYKPAYKDVTGKDADDIGIALWGLNKTLKTMFEAAGKTMSRESLIATLESGKTFASGVYPPVTYSASDHYGGAQMHLLQADCAPPRVFKTVARFAGSF